MHREAYVAGPHFQEVVDLTVGALLQQAVAKAPDRPALVEGAPEVADRRRWTYAELNRDATTCASFLLDNFAPGERIAVWAGNSPEYTVLQYGIALAGMTMVTLNPALRSGEAGHILQRAEVAGCFASAAYRDRSPHEMAVLLAQSTPSLRDVFSIDDLLTDMAGSVEGRALPDVDPLSAAQILFTSGTTGLPKGAMLSHRAMTNNVPPAAKIIAAGNETAPVWLLSLPMFHLAGCVVATVGTASLQGALLVVERFEADLVLRLIEQEAVTTMNQVPTLLKALLDNPAWASHDLSSFTSVMLGGAPVPAQLVRTLREQHGIASLIGYGMTEAAHITITQSDDTPEDAALTCGTPLPGVEVRVVDGVTGGPVELGQVGQVLTRGFHVLLGYYGDPASTAKALEGGWLHTGDLGSLDERGYLSIVGRATDMIIRGGENVYPREVEEQLLLLPGVGEVAVVGLPDDYYGEVVAAFVRADDGGVDLPDLRAALSTVVTGYKVPSKWFLVDDFPRTSSGKIQKFALRESWVSGDHVETPA